MAVNVSIAPATLGHAYALFPLMRAADVAELERFGLEPREALLDCVRWSDEAYACFFGEEVAFLCGVRAHRETALGASGVGTVWMLSGHACSKHRATFLRTTRLLLSDFLKRYTTLVNIIDAEYAGALRWAEWLGGEIRPAAPFGPKQSRFHPCVFRRS